MRYKKIDFESEMKFENDCLLLMSLMTSKIFMNIWHIQKKVVYFLTTKTLFYVTKDTGDNL